MFRPRAVFASMLVALALALALSGAAACDDAAVPQACTDIPAGGCPLSHGVGCADPACEAVYRCHANNVWELQQRCPARDGAATTSSDAAADASTATQDGALDAPPGAFGGPGCASLQEPDCALGVALSCGADCCGCEDLYVCEDGAWALWGACGDGGVRQGR
jgi:hypothetical protein